MKKCIMMLVFCAMAGLCFAQATFAAGGGTTTTSGGTVSDCIGQIMSTSKVAWSGTVDAGVEQAYEIISLGIDNYPTIALTATVYPNPTTSGLNLRVADQGLGELTAVLINAAGQTIQTVKVNAENTQIDMQGMANGIYFLNVKNSKNNLKTFKIVKQ